MALLREIERFLIATGMPWSRFGRLAVGDPRLVSDMRNGRVPQPPHREPGSRVHAGAPVGFACLDAAFGAGVGAAALWVLACIYTARRPSYRLSPEHVEKLLRPRPRGPVLDSASFESDPGAEPASEEHRHAEQMD